MTQPYVLESPGPGGVDVVQQDGQPVALPAVSAAVIAGSFAPLSRTLFVDGGTAVPTGNQTGSVGLPFATIAQAIAAIPAIASVSDADSLWTICVTPCLGGYTSEPATLTFPPNRNVCLKGIGLTSGLLPGNGLNVAANLAYSTIKTGPLPTLAGVLSVNDVDISGNITLSDAGTGSPFSVLLLQASTHTATIEGVPFARTVTGNISVTAVEGFFVVIAGYLVEGSYTTPGGCVLGISGAEIQGACTCGALTAWLTTFAGTFSSVATSSNLIATECTFIGAMTGTNTLAGIFTDCYFRAPTIDLPPTQTYLNCRWIGVDPATPSASVLSSDAIMDAASYVSFLHGGGTLSGGAVVTVSGQTADAYLAGEQFLVAQPGNQSTISPATFPGTPLAAFNLTPTQTGIIDLRGEVLVNPTAPDSLEFDVQIQTGSASAGYAPTNAVNALLGSDTSALTVPGAGTVIGRFQEGFGAAVEQRSMTLACSCEVAPGTAVCVVVYASSTVGANPWIASLNMAARERSLN